jgi:dephospho-CoA kinase
MAKQKLNKKVVVGITGNFGSGKSTVARLLASYEAKIIDADKIAHRCLSRGNKVYRKIVSVFGDTILGKNKEIDRCRLGKVVFGDKKLLKKLNGIVHPEVIRIIKSKINSKKKGVMVLDAPLLLEAGLRSAVDKLIVVTINRDTQIMRLLKKTSLKKADILKRIKSQIPLRAKARLADFIIDNNGSLAKTRKQVKGIIVNWQPKKEGKFDSSSCGTRS